MIRDLPPPRKTKRIKDVGWCPQPSSRSRKACQAAPGSAAAVIGRRFGRTKLPGGRSLEGSLAFVLAGGLPALAVLLGFHHLPLVTAAVVALSGAVAGAAAEVLSGRLDDNFTIPLIASLSAWGAHSLLA